jgi:hypothetical protein
MTEKFTLRDILVYTLLGLIVILFTYLRYPIEISSIVKDSKDYSDLTVLLLIPFSYLIGHLLMSVDDVIFNGILLRFFPKEKPLEKKGWKIFNFIFFSYRNIGLRNSIGLTNDQFLSACDKLIEQKNYEKPEYYQVMSDLFKGIFLIIVLSILLDICYKDVVFWKFIVALLMWYRARMFSAYYIKMVNRSITTTNANSC